MEGLQPCDACSVEPYINDPESFASRRGRPNCCENLKVLGVHVDGGLRPGFVVPARKLHRSRRLSFEQLALVETLAIGCHAVDRASPVSGEDLLVIGAGPIGLSVIEFAHLAGSRITVLDMNEKRLAFCEHTMGVAHTVRFTDHESAGKELAEVTDGHRFPVVIDATGNARSMSGAPEHVAHTGRLVYVGITTHNLTISDPLMHRREITLLASRNAMPGDFQRIIRLIEEGKIDTRPWITHRTRFDELIGVFESFTRPETGVIKAMVELPGSP